MDSHSELAESLYADIDAAGVEVKGRPAIKYAENDSGAAECFVDEHKDIVRYVPHWKTWLIWQGHYWKRDDMSKVVSLAVRHAKSLLAKAIETPMPAAERPKILGRICRRGEEPAIRHMLQLAAADQRITLHPDELDANPDLLAAANGVMDFREDHFRAGRPEDNITRAVNAVYDPDASCPLWDAHIRKITGGDQKLAEFLQRAAGYSFTGHTSAQVFFFLWGSGCNGKSVFLDCLLHLAGDHGHKADPSLYQADRHGKSPVDEIAAIAGKRLVIGTEVEERQRLAEARVKEFVDAKRLAGRAQYERRFEFKPACKLWLFGNHKPVIHGNDDGIWRRVRLVPFTQQIRPDEIVLGLTEKICTQEAAGVLNWIARGAMAWLSSGDLAAPSIVAAATAEYREEEDVLAEFIEGELVFSETAWISRAQVYELYVEWAKRLQIHPLKRNTFNSKLRARPGVEEGKQGDVRGWKGVGLAEA
jgi:putative DNA primase/helicase